MRRAGRTGVRCASAMCAGAMLGWVGGTGLAADLGGPGDFGQIAKRGFELTVDGAFYLDAEKSQFPNLKPDLGSYQNSYSWSSAWFDNSLWIGTVRNPFEDDRVVAGGAEVWRYYPSSADAAGDFGLSGRWERVYVSPLISPLIALLSGGEVPYNFPRFFGFRGMEVCNAGDNVERLYMTASGFPPAVLHTRGNNTVQEVLGIGLPEATLDLRRLLRGILTLSLRDMLPAFGETSSRGLPTGVTGLADGTSDLGFRGLTCFKGRLFTSPAGSIEDVDLAKNPVLLMNADPANGGVWETVVDVQSGHPLANPNNVGIFQMEALGDYLWLSVINRVEGFELWRGDGSDCAPPWIHGACNLTWTKVISDGAGRPPDNFGPEVDNAGATLGVFGNDLYVSPAESGFLDPTLAELLRVRDAHQPPDTGNRATPHQWQLIAGWPRRDYARPADRRAGLENLDCTTPGSDSDPVTDPPEWTNYRGPRFFFIPQLASNNFSIRWLSDAERDGGYGYDDCLPMSGSGPGLATDPNYLDPLLPGTNSYLWRMREHEGGFYIGSLDLISSTSARYPGDQRGFNLYRTTDGVQFEQIVNDGLGNPSAYGVRGLISCPVGLALATANGFPVVSNDVSLAGTDVFIGTTVAGNSAAPKADAGPDQTVLDETPPGTVTVQLKGRGTPSFGGELDPGLPFDWYRGSIASLGGRCSGIFGPTNQIPGDPTSPDRDSVEVDSPGKHTFTFLVRNSAGKVGCDEMTVTVRGPAGLFPPEVAVAFPKVGGVYYPASFRVGCENWLRPGICGTVSEGDRSVTAVDVSVKRISDGAWWDGADFTDAGGPIWVPASQGPNWFLDFVPASGSYRVQARAVDEDGIEGLSGVVEFQYRRRVPVLQ